MTNKILVPAQEAAQILSIAKSTLWRDVKRKKLPAPIKIGGATRWRVSDLQQFVANQPTTASSPA